MRQANLTLLALCLLSFTFNSTAQDSAATADAFPIGAYLAPAAQNGTLNGATSTGSLDCDGYAVGIDHWYTFTTDSPGIKFTMTATGFTPLLSMFEEDGTTLIECSPEAAAGAITWFFNKMQIGETYLLRLSALPTDVAPQNYSLQSQKLPHSTIASAYQGLGLSGMGYTSSLNPKSGFLPNVEDFRYEIFDTQTDNLVDEYQAGAANSNLVLGGLNNMEYEKTYDVTVEVMFEGEWCGKSERTQIIMQPFRSIALKPEYCGATFDFGDGIICDFEEWAEEYTWRFFTDNGNTVFELVSPTNVINFQNENEMLFGKIYAVDVKVKVHDVYGEYTSVCPLFSPLLPYTQLTPNFCGAQNPGIVQFEWYAGGDSWISKVFRVDENDPYFTPQSEIMLHQSSVYNDVFIPVGQMLTEPGVYAVSTKMVRGNAANGDVVQQGDWGPHCLIYFGVEPAEIGQTGNNDQGENFASIEKALDFELFPNPATTHVVLNFSSVPQDAVVRLSTASGVVVKSLKNVSNRISLDTSSLAPGYYLINVSSALGSETKKLIVR